MLVTTSVTTYKYLKRFKYILYNKVMILQFLWNSYYNNLGIYGNS